MTLQAAVETRFCVVRDGDDPYWLKDGRSGERFVWVGDVPEVVVVRAAGESPRRVFDGFLQDFEAGARVRLREALKAADAERILGCFVDEGPVFDGVGHWAPRQTYTLLEEALDRAPGDAAREAAVDFLRRSYPSFEWFAGAWGVDIYGDFEKLQGRELAACYNVETQTKRGRFASLLAEAYLGGLARALRAEAPTVLNLGVRFAQEAPLAVLEACGRLCDVVSMSSADADALGRAWLAGGKPILVVGANTESGREALAHPMVVGVEGAAMAASQAHEIHAEGGRGYPTTLIEREAVTFVVGPMGDKALQVDLLGEETTFEPQVWTDGGASVAMRRDEDALMLDYDTGSGKGWRVLFGGPKSLARSNGPTGATDLHGYTRLLVDAELPEGTEFKMYLYEGGADEAGKDDYDLRGGDEAHAFETNVMVAKSGRRRYTHGMGDLFLQTKEGWQHGNQKGSGRVHLECVKGLCIAMVGGQGKGTMILRGLKVYRG